MEEIKVLLVEDDPFWQQQLSADLNHEQDIRVVAVADTKEKALQETLDTDCNLILMDLNLTGNNLDGLEAIDEILKKVKRPLHIIVLTSLTDQKVILQTFQSGAFNFINKSSYQDIIKAIRDAHNNQSSIHPDAAKVIREEIRLMTLTPMEREVYELKNKGLNKTEISKLLHKSINTIKTQLRSVNNKLKGM